MSSNLKVNTILPSTGTSIGIGTAGGVTTASGDFSIADKIIHTGDTDTAIRFPAADTFTVETGGSERVRIDSSGRVLLGHNVSVPTGGSATAHFKLQVQGTGFDSSGIFQQRYQNGTAGASLYLGHSRGGIGVQTALQQGDEVGKIAFVASDGTDFAGQAGRIQCLMATNATSDDTPGHLTFNTCPSGSNSTIERVRITSTGRLNVGDTDMSQNVDQFSVTIAAQNAVDNVARFQSNAAASGTSESLLKVYKGAGYGGVVSGYITQGSDHGLKLYTANNGTMSERLRINSSGHITTPSNVLFSANGGQGDLTNGVFIFTNVLFQRGGTNYNNSNGYFTAPVDGIYMFMCNPYRYQDSNDSLISLQKSTNGGSSWSTYHETRAQNSFGGDSGRGWTSLTMSTMIDLNKNDIVRIYAGNRCHANGTVTVYSGMLVG